ncbi:MAG TPA: NAD(P)/FAD-dependent oxidoreductase [Humisphaera sp.]
MDPDRYDVVIVGGAFSGAATALLLKRQMPALRVLVVEKRTAFDAKVGEATTEMSAMFLTRRLGLWRHLEMEHLPKEGLRYWSANDRVTGHADASETGPYYRSTVPSFQLRRDVLDEHVLKLAVEAGAELLRPATVRDVDVQPWDSAVTVSHKVDGRDETRTVRATWLLDASGRQHFLGRRLDLIEWNEAHPVASIWARWDNVRHIDDLCALTPDLPAGGNVGSRRLGTNHYVGRGFWVWVIPLGNGQTSVGVVFDKRVHQLHEAPDRAAAYVAFLNCHPALAELLAGATPDKADLRGLSRVAYCTKQYMGDGWALLGDAAAFLDPYYSPGLDHCSFCAEATADIVLARARGESPDVLAKRIASHNDLFLRSYRWFFRAVYRDKYAFFGEHDLISAAFLIDTALYYVFSVIPAYRFAKRFRSEPVLSPRAAFPFLAGMTFAKWRFRRLADLRARAGEAGARNDRRRVRAFYNLEYPAVLRMLGRGLKLWAYAEADGLRLRAKLLLGKRAPQNSNPVVTAVPSHAGA